MQSWRIHIYMSWSESIFVTMWTTVVPVPKVKSQVFSALYNKFYSARTKKTPAVVSQTSCPFSSVFCLHQWPQEMLFMRSCEPSCSLHCIPLEVPIPKSHLIRDVGRHPLAPPHPTPPFLYPSVDVLFLSLSNCFWNLLVLIACGSKIQKSTTWCIKTYLFWICFWEFQEVSMSSV